MIIEYGFFILIVVGILVWVSWALRAAPPPGNRRVCSTCGAPHVPMAKFCPRCGKRVKAES